MNYRIDNNRIYMTLAKGDMINKTFEVFAESDDIGCAWINGIGALANPKILNKSVFGSVTNLNNIFFSLAPS